MSRLGGSSFGFAASYLICTIVLTGGSSQKLFSRHSKPEASRAADDESAIAEAILTLRSAESAADRAQAAQTLGAVGGQRETAPLIAALFDDSPEVRHAAGEALAQIGDPTISFGPLSALVNGNVDWGAPEVVQPSIPAEVTDAEAAQATSANEQPLTLGQPPAPDPFIETNEELVHLDADAITNSLADLRRRLGETIAARMEVEERARLCAESDVNVRARIATRRREEEELRKQAEEESARHRREEESKLQAELTARLQSENEARSLAEQESELRLEVLRLRQMADELAQSRAEVEDAARAARVEDAERKRRDAEGQHTAELEHLREEEEALRIAAERVANGRREIEDARQESEILLRQLEREKTQLVADEVARITEAERLRSELQDKGRVEQEQLLVQIAELRRVAEEVAVRRAAIDAGRRHAEEAAQRLLEVQSRIEAAEASSRQREAERLKVEAEIYERVETEQRLLEEARLRAQADQQLLEDSARLRAEEEERRLEALESLRHRIELETQERAEKERQLSAELERLRIAEGEAGKRIEDAEISRRRAEETHNLTVEKLQRVEAEAHARATEEDRILAKLAEVQRNVAVEAQAREEQEKRVREEIEVLRRLEEEQRQRLEDEIRRRREAEARLQQAKDRYRTEEEGRVRAEAELEQLLVREQPGKKEEAEDWRDEPIENLRPVRIGSAGEATVQAEGVVKPADRADVLRSVSSSADSPGILEKLKSSDPRTRAGAISELAQSGVKDPFSLIVHCFDDQSVDVRNAAARALRELDPARPVEVCTRALDEASPERRQNIGTAIATSGLAAVAIEALRGDNREDTYNALCLLFAMAKTGELEPLVKAVEGHHDVEVRRASVKLLTLAGQEAIAGAAAKRRLDVEA
jgi:hypothetical protein